MEIYKVYSPDLYLLNEGLESLFLRVENTPTDYQVFNTLFQQILNYFHLRVQLGKLYQSFFLIPHNSIICPLGQSIKINLSRFLVQIYSNT